MNVTTVAVHSSDYSEVKSEPVIAYKTKAQMVTDLRKVLGAVENF